MARKVKRTMKTRTKTRTQRKQRTLKKQRTQRKQRNTKKRGGKRVNWRQTSLRSLRTSPLAQDAKRKINYARNQAGESFQNVKRSLQNLKTSVVSKIPTRVPSQKEKHEETIKYVLNELPEEKRETFLNNLQNAGETLLFRLFMSPLFLFQWAIAHS